MRIFDRSYLTRLPEPKWLIEDIIPEDGLTIIRGKFASMKTFLALDWGNSVATGQSWLGRQTRPAPVLYMIGESPRGVNKRMVAWEEEYRPVKNWWATTDLPDLSNSSTPRQLQAACAEAGIEPKLLVIDTLARHFGTGDENSTQDMNTFVRVCDAVRNTFIGSTLLMIHHIGKDARRGSRGNSALEGAAETIIEVTKDDRSRTVTLSCAKQKDADSFEPIVLAWKPVADSIILTNDMTFRTLQTRQYRADRALASLMQHPQGLLAKQWRDVTKLSGANWKQAAEDLLEQGRVARDEHNVYTAV